MNTRKPTLYPVIDLYMDQRDMRQYQFADQLGMQQSDLSKRLHDVLPWTPAWRAKVSMFLGLPEEEVFRKEL